MFGLRKPPSRTISLKKTHILVAALQIKNTVQLSWTDKTRLQASLCVTGLTGSSRCHVRQRTYYDSGTIGKEQYTILTPENVVLVILVSFRAHFD